MHLNFLREDRRSLVPINQEQAKLICSIGGKTYLAAPMEKHSRLDFRACAIIPCRTIQNPKLSTTGKSENLEKKAGAYGSCSNHIFQLQARAEASHLIRFTATQAL